MGFPFPSYDTRSLMWATEETLLEAIEENRREIMKIPFPSPGMCSLICANEETVLEAIEQLRSERIPGCDLIFLEDVIIYIMPTSETTFIKI